MDRTNLKGWSRENLADRIDELERRVIHLEGESLSIHPHFVMECVSATGIYYSGCAGCGRPVQPIGDLKV